MESMTSGRWPDRKSGRGCWLGTAESVRRQAFDSVGRDCPNAVRTQLPLRQRRLAYPASTD